ncbi:hypothetical protein LSH36_723g01034 [Paralvinella palmiformis]|uniref:glucose-6-phosphatase n=1 Tax=Paralvinella palmiformis TaxID=53620 RepID=A0AAD9J3D7_9ANNE|nr:hypothetical protein LSH36_723g01034 [Paralvinella palmiformis]
MAQRYDVKYHLHTDDTQLHLSLDLDNLCDMSPVLMDRLHLLGVDFILSLQHYFKHQDEVMLFLSHIGDPKNAFLIYFPLAFFCHRATGIKVMWAAVISEWLNSALKWILFGQRPYWWIHTSGLYGDEVPHLEQYRLTCETGPGSPSGHAMVTSSVTFVLMRCYLKYQASNTKRGYVRKIVLWTTFLSLMILVCISRCFIATHFPHQVIAGVIVGSVIGEAIFRHDTTAVSLRTYVLLSPIIMMSAPMFYSLVSILGQDPVWSVTLSQTWCAKTEWVHLDTTLFYAATRDASVLLSTGLGLWMTHNQLEQDGINGRVIVQTGVSVTFARLMERVKVNQQVPLLFYSVAFAKYFLLFTVMVVFVRKISNLLQPLNKSQKKDG